MRRDEMLQEIASLDDQINTHLAGAKIPTLDKKPFPLGTWIVAAIFFALSYYGHLIPEVGEQIHQYGKWMLYAGILMAVLAVLSTLAWIMSKLKKDNTTEYREATAKVKVLQERRQQLVLKIKELDSD